MLRNMPANPPAAIFKLYRVGVMFALLTALESNVAAAESYERLVGAIERDDVAALERVLSGGDLDSRIGFGDTVLFISAAKGSARCARWLVGRGADPNAPSTHNAMPIHAAASKGDLEIVRLLLAAGAKVNLHGGDYGETPLHYAVKSGSVSVVEHLLDAGADVSAGGTNSAGRQPLHVAADQNELAIIKILLDKGAPIDGRSGWQYTALHYASFPTPKFMARLSLGMPVRGHLEAARILIDRGASVTVATERGDTPLHQAAHAHNLRLVALLIQSGANASALNQNGRTPLHLAVRSYPPLDPRTQVQVIEALVKAGANPNVRSGVCETPLHAAAYNGFSDAVRALVRLGADVKATISKEQRSHQHCVDKGQTALDWARNARSKENRNPGFYEPPDAVDWDETISILQAGGPTGKSPRLSVISVSAFRPRISEPCWWATVPT